MAEETDLCAIFLTTKMAADTSGSGSLEDLSDGITDRIFDSLADQDEETYPIVVFNMRTKGNIKRVIMGEKIGSRVF